MTDVLKIALDRRAQLQDEVAKLDEFIRMAESLMSGSPKVQPIPARAPEAHVEAPDAGETVVRTAMRRANDVEADATDVPRPSIIRRSANNAV